MMRLQTSASVIYPFSRSKTDQYQGGDRSHGFRNMSDEDEWRGILKKPIFHLTGREVCFVG